MFITGLEAGWEVGRWQACEVKTSRPAQVRVVRDFVCQSSVSVPVSRLERLKLTVRQGRADVARRLRKSGVEIKSIVTVVGRWVYFPSVVDLVLASLRLRLCRSIRDNFTMSSKPRKGSAASGENAQGGGTTQPEPHTLTAARDSHSDGHVSDTPSQSSVIKCKRLLVLFSLSRGCGCASPECAVLLCFPADPGEESDVDRELVVSDSEGDDRLHIQEQVRGCMSIRNPYCPPL